MARALTTVFRPYSAIYAEAEKCRDIGGLGSSIDFSITDFILGPLRSKYRGSLAINIDTRNSLEELARVDFIENRRSIVLQVRKSVWDAALDKEAEGRRVLAHEIGHIWLHKDDKFGFSEFSEFSRRFVEPEYYVEDQANLFADVFLLPDCALKAFSSRQDIIEYCDYYCGIPNDVIDRRFAVAQDLNKYHFGPKYDPSRVCRSCGGDRVRCILSYTACDDCKNITY
ncbi:ImmA/IrrE family metallo-endopeptidase [uncultured Methylobacterium sp.]|uniref:ImmA/IrrE family metallo-endopeptidase n=1 Tax=uncultured Methylobacterium sp. TaxID=157278 RepID=UPI0035CC4CD6